MGCHFLLQGIFPTQLSNLGRPHLQADGLPSEPPGKLSLLQGNLPNPGIKPRSPTFQADSLPAEPQGKPKNTGVGSLSLFQQIFPTQELNQSLLHFKQILYQLSYQGSPEYNTSTEITGFVFSNCFRLKAYHLGEIHILVITFH